MAVDRVEYGGFVIDGTYFVTIYIATQMKSVVVDDGTGREVIILDNKFACVEMIEI